MSAFESIKQGLLEAIEIEKGNIPMVEKMGLPAPTFSVQNKEDVIIPKTE